MAVMSRCGFEPSLLGKLPEISLRVVDVDGLLLLGEHEMVWSGRLNLAWDHGHSHSRRDTHLDLR